MLLCDTGVLLAAGNIKDQAHRACVKLLRQAEGPLLVDRPGDLGGSDPWEDAESCQHSGSTLMSCASAR
jgi:hypothetical protein